MNDVELRLECLRLATNACGADAVRFAGRYYDFIMQTGDAKILEAARNLAEMVKSNA